MLCCDVSRNNCLEHTWLKWGFPQSYGDKDTFLMTLRILRISNGQLGKLFFLIVKKREKLSTQIRLSTKYTVYRNKKYIYMDSLYFINSTREKRILMNTRHRQVLCISHCKEAIILFKISIGFSLCVFLLIL